MNMHIRSPDSLALDQAVKYISQRTRKTIRIAEGLFHIALREGALVAFGEFFYQDDFRRDRVPASTWGDLTSKQFHSYTIGCNVPKHPLALEPEYHGHFRDITISVTSVDGWLKSLPQTPEYVSVEQVKLWLVALARKNKNLMPSRDEGWEKCQRHFGARKVSVKTYKSAFEETKKRATVLKITPPRMGRRKKSENLN